MVSDGAKKKTTLSDGFTFNTYEDLVSSMSGITLYEPVSNRFYTYTNRFGAPGLIDIETGTRIFGNDIKEAVQFPLHRIRFVPHLAEELNAT